MLRPSTIAALNSHIEKTGCLAMAIQPGPGQARRHGESHDQVNLLKVYSLVPTAMAAIDHFWGKAKQGAYGS